jgi:hypothetical protein
LAISQIACTDRLPEDSENWITAQAEPVSILGDDTPNENLTIAMLTIEALCDSGYPAESCFRDGNRQLPPGATMLPVQIVIEQRGATADLLCMTSGNPPNYEIIEDCRTRLLTVFNK